MSSAKSGAVPPKGRTAGLVESELPDELLVYDLVRHRAHSLNRTAALCAQPSIRGGWGRRSPPTLPVLA
jgi:hypothetical protein